MATELRPLFATLEVASTGAGAAQSLKLEGAAAASGGVNYAGMMVGKDPSDNLQFLSLNSNNELIVDTESAEVACVFEAPEHGEGCGDCEKGTHRIGRSGIWKIGKWELGKSRLCRSCFWERS